MITLYKKINVPDLLPCTSRLIDIKTYPPRNITWLITTTDVNGTDITEELGTSSVNVSTLSFVGSNGWNRRNAIHYTCIIRHTDSYWEYKSFEVKFYNVSTPYIVTVQISMSSMATALRNDYSLSIILNVILSIILWYI